uniref:Uncharacterized protein n=1 Tax=Arion vulgaris TaxID=1028688 RepID=A0A0B7AIG7_9EUPU
MDWINDFEDVFIDDFDASDNEKYNTNKTYDSTIRDDENKSDRDEETVTDGFGSQKVKTTNFEDDLYDDNYDSSDIDKDNDGDLDTNYENEETEGETDSAEEFVINASYEGGYELVEKTPSDSIGNDNDDLAETWDNSDSAGQAALDEISIDEVDSANNDSNSNESDVITEDKLEGRIIDVHALWRPLQDFNKDRTYTTDDWFDKENMDSEEEYPENEDNKEDIDAVKEEDQVGNLGERGNDDDDDEYYVTKWTHEDDDDEDDDNETEWDAETDDDVEEDFDELKNHVVNEPVDELAKKSKIPTAPTSMVLFYTWMIVAVLIVIVGISTYQSRCRGFKFPGIKTASNSKDDRKRLIEHEFV